MQRPRLARCATHVVANVWEVGRRLTQGLMVNHYKAGKKAFPGQEDYNTNSRLLQGLSWGRVQDKVVGDAEWGRRRAEPRRLKMEEAPSNLKGTPSFRPPTNFRLPPEGPTLAPERPEPDGLWDSIDGIPTVAPGGKTAIRPSCGSRGIQSRDRRTARQLQVVFGGFSLGENFQLLGTPSTITLSQL